MSLLETNARVAGCGFFAGKKECTHIIGMVFKKKAKNALLLIIDTLGEKNWREKMHVLNKKMLNIDNTSGLDL